MSEDAQQQLEAALRQILLLRGNGASPAIIEAMVEEARELWSQTPGDRRAWDPDIAALADELRFTAENESAEKDPADSDGRWLQLASQIDAAIVEAGGVGNLRVTCSPQRIVLSGIAADEDARDQALIVAAKLAPGVEIEDAIDVA